MSKLKTILAELAPTATTLVAVSKTKPNEAILSLYDQGQRIFGENRVQELVQKYESLPRDIEWHMIGHLQKNKVKYIAHFVEMIHSVDNLALLKVIDKKAADNERKIKVLLQVKIAEEESKYGFDSNTLMEDLNPGDFPNVIFSGLMGMATFTEDMDQVRNEFKKLLVFKENIKEKHFSKSDTFKEVSIGMSGDYKIAIEEGSTMVRIGSLLFGRRD